MLRMAEEELQRVGDITSRYFISIAIQDPARGPPGGHSRRACFLYRNRLEMRRSRLCGQYRSRASILAHPESCARLSPIWSRMQSMPCLVVADSPETA